MQQGLHPGNNESNDTKVRAQEPYVELRLHHITYFRQHVIKHGLRRGINLYLFLD